MPYISKLPISTVYPEAKTSLELWEYISKNSIPVGFRDLPHPLVRTDKMKPHKALIVTGVLSTGCLRIRRKDSKGINASGDRVLTVRPSQLGLLVFEDHFNKQTKGEEAQVKTEEAQKNIAHALAIPKTPSKVATATVTGIKYDSDKLEFSLLPKGVLQPVLRVLSFGKKKYAADNWQRVDNSKERYYNALQRHLTQWWEGEKTDPETGENHLAHAACCVFFLLWFDNQTTGKS